ncbi:MAG: PHP domain-containing protein [Rhodocyclaceae bacterium]|jgi:predicted metal-dependent phosphoesterase TrpH|nr:PHP domain-containing protein [Rhodocyclaceae bacterium]
MTFAASRPPGLQKYDLHCHSTASDGMLPPADVVARAHANGVTTLALTDHDGLSGLPEAQAAADALGVSLVPGTEISVEWNDYSVHIVGLRIDPKNPAIVAGLDGIRIGRATRAERIAAELEKVGFKGILARTMTYVGNPELVSRAHFARALVDMGACREVKQVFDRYLTPGKPGFVAHPWPSLAEALGWIRAAGGVAVIAHPGRYRMSNRELGKLFEAFRELGGEAIEVASGSHTPEQVAHFGRQARHYAFMGSQGSDFHAPGESYVDLGGGLPLPEGVVPVWNNW